MADKRPSVKPDLKTSVTMADKTNTVPENRAVLSTHYIIKLSTLE